MMKRPFAPKTLHDVRVRKGEVRRRVGVLGGSFDPIHNGHVALARQLLASVGLDEVWFMVSPQNPLKQQVDLLDDHLRLEMARRALHGEERLVASDFEFHLPRPSYTWHTLNELRAAFPKVDFTLLIGADNWAAFDRWAHPEEIIRRFHIAIYPRENYVVEEQKLPPHVKLIHTELFNVSSTLVRQLIASGQPYAHLVPPCVAEFIEQYRLYR